MSPPTSRKAIFLCLTTLVILSFFVYGMSLSGKTDHTKVQITSAKTPPVTTMDSALQNASAPLVLCGEAKPQPRRAHAQISVPMELIEIDDGDTFCIWWPEGAETIRILGIDTAEVAHDFPKMDDQPYGPDARGFMQGVLAMANKIEIERADCLDKYDRTLAYVFMGDDQNYSVLVVEAHLAFETVTKYGDNGFPEYASEVLEASDAVVLPYLEETPSNFRKRMRVKYAPSPEPYLP